MDGFFEGFTGFLVFIIIFMTFVQNIIVKLTPVVDKIFNGIEKFLLALKLPKFLVAIIIYVILWIPFGIGMTITVLVVHYSVLGQKIIFSLSFKIYEIFSDQGRQDPNLIFHFFDRAYKDIHAKAVDPFEEYGYRTLGKD